MTKNISVEAGAYFVLCLFLLLLGPKWTLSILFAAMIHELGHIAMLWCWGKRICGIRILPFGARIDTEFLSGEEGIFCALAGPAAGLLLLFFWRWIPKVSFCALVQSGFNLLPVYPLDGGRALRYWWEQKAVAKFRDWSYNKKD